MPILIVKRKMEQWNNHLALEDNKEQGFGLSIIPVSSMKIPFNSWAMYQSSIAPVEGWFNHYCTQGTVGIITGKVSGNLECIDIDVKNDPLEYMVLFPKELFSRLIVQTTPNKGFHLIYRCPEVVIEKNQKLALNNNQVVIIETRGEGGYFCSNKVNNKILQGQFDLENLDVDIPVITAKEREMLFETASYIHDDRHLLQELYQDYVVQSDLEMIIAEFVELPDTISDLFAITCLDLLTTLTRKFPEYSKRINVTAVGKLMSEKGYDCVRKGKNRISCYMINKNSKISSLISNDAQSWQLLLESQVDKLNKNKYDNKN